jgi:hypothetical protein
MDKRCVLLLLPVKQRQGQQLHYLQDEVSVKTSTSRFRSSIECIITHAMLRTSIIRSERAIERSITAADALGTAL